MYRRKLLKAASSGPEAILLLVAMSLALFATGCKSGPTAEEQAVESYLRGAELQRQGSMRAAGDAYSDAVRLDPGYAEAYAGRGYIFYVHNNFQSAILDLNRAIALKPDLAVAYSYRGMAYEGMPNDQSALLNLTRAIELDPRLKEAYYRRATLFVRAGDIEAAIDDLTEVIALDPENTDYYVERAQAYAAIGDRSRAALDLEKVIALARDDETRAAARRLLLALQQAEPR